MSGGSLDYAYYHIDNLADEIERKFLHNGKTKTEEYDYLEGATEEQKRLILEEVCLLQKDLRKNAKRSKELEWFLSGDTGFESYLERLNNLK